MSSIIIIWVILHNIQDQRNISKSDPEDKHIVYP